ncbi:MAG TPA: hypothetical protein VIG25_25680 [Pyrinomonadaceae bacterium]|jgi:hypothetical protein
MSEQREHTSAAQTVSRNLAIVLLRIALVVLLVGAGWVIYKQLPVTESETVPNNVGTNVQIILRNVPETGASALDVRVDIYPVDIIAVRHEFFTEPRAGKRFEDFLKERMKGRAPINTKLDHEGHGSVYLPPGNWWLHTTLPGEEEIEWRLPLTITGQKQTIELTPQNAYTRSKSF